MINEAEQEFLPATLTLIDWDKELIKTTSWNDLEAILSTLPKVAYTPNTIVNLVHPLGGTISIGIAGEGDLDNSDMLEPLACINFISPSNEPPYLSVVGNNNESAQSAIVVFRYENGTWTEIPRRNCVSITRMLQIVKYFAFHGKLPEWADWEEV